MEGLLRMEGGDQILPFVRCFYGSPSTFCGRMNWPTHKTSHRGKEGSKENPSCRFYFPCRFRERGVRCAPETVLETHRILEEEILAHTQIRMQREDTGLEPRVSNTHWRGSSDGPTGETRCNRCLRHNRVRRSWEFLWDNQGLSGGSWKRNRRNMLCCLSAYQPCDIHNQHGCSWSCAPQRGPISGERSPTGVDRVVCRDTRHPCLGVFATDIEDPRQESLPDHRIVAILTKWFGTCQHQQDQEPTGPATPSVSGRDNDS